MRLIATLKRDKAKNGAPSLRCEFPLDRRPFMREAILKRNLGARPYGEMSFKDGNKFVVVYFK